MGLRRLFGARRSLLLILASSLALKLVLLSIVAKDPGRLMSNDSMTYIQPAEALLTSGVYAVSALRPEVPATLRTPGYPVFIAAVYRLAGRQPVALALAQIVLSLATQVLAFGIAEQLWNRRAGVCAALFLALDLASFVFSLRLLSETLFTFLLTAALFCGVRFARRFARLAPGLEWCALFGLLFAASVMVRPIAYFLVAVLAPWVILVCARQQATRRQTAAAVLAFVMPFVLIVGGWQLRNRLRTGTPVLSRIVGINMLFYRAAAVVALRDGISLAQARHHLGYKRYTELHPRAAELSPEQLNERWRGEGLAIIRRHPMLFARTMVKPVCVMLLGTPEHSLFELLGLPLPSTGPLGDLTRLDIGSYVERWVLGDSLSWALFVALSGYQLVLYLGVGIAIWRLSRGGRLTLEDGCLGLVFCYLLLISAGPEAYSRFRVPLMPLVCVYAAAGLTGGARSGGDARLLDGSSAR